MNTDSNSPYPVSVGRSWPLGVTPEGDGSNVAVWSPEATKVELCVFSDAGETRVEIPYRDGGVWHAHVKGLVAGTQYGLRVSGPHQPERGQRFNPNKLLIDPYAKMLTGPVRWHKLMRGYTDGPRDDMRMDTRDSAEVMPKGIVQGPASGPDPTTNRPGHLWTHTVIYEAHVKGLTKLNPNVPEELRGTYAGLSQPAVIDHLTRIGVTAIELLPIQTFLDDEFLVRQNKRNYWGYQPVAWQAPEPRYAYKDADAEIRTFVHAMHEAGIEVILDIVFNHTGEGDGLGPVVSYKALNNSGYYELMNEGRHYLNITGTGNTLAVDRSMTLRLVMDSMRHWVNRYGIDGFRFDLATTVGRFHGPFTREAPFFHAVRQDPDLAGTKLIAEPWDLGQGGYQLGNYPYPWKEWNDSYRDNVRDAWRGQSLGKADMGSKLLGSAGTFDHSGRSASSSINFLTAHDGFTLHDVVSYNDKHNEANGEDNRDGHTNNYSANMGAEGPTDDPAINDARARRVRGMLATLFVSQGVPMMLAGDELSNSQGGNNNAYTLDNETGWVNWDHANEELIDFVASLAQMRQRLPLLRQRHFLHGGTRADDAVDVQWFTPHGEGPDDATWNDPELRTIGVELRGAAGFRSGEELSGSVFIILNTGGDVEFTLPPVADEGQWFLELDSAQPGATGSFADTYAVPGQSVVVFSQGIV